MRAIDFAIFGTLGALWTFGAVFIWLVWRWVIRYERSRSSAHDEASS